VLGVGYRFDEGKLLDAVAGCQQRLPTGVELAAGELVGYYFY